MRSNYHEVAARMTYKGGRANWAFNPKTDRTFTTMCDTAKEVNVPADDKPAPPRDWMYQKSHAALRRDRKVLRRVK